MKFEKPEHNNIAEMLRSMNSGLLMESCCYFGGGTAIVMKHGEYRRSLDVDFLCSDRAGFREIRSALVSKGLAALFSPEVKLLRDIRSDGYGIRYLLEYKGQPVKFEIVREARLDLNGTIDPDLRVPILSAEDMFAEKLLANADRCYDKSIAYRDAFDLGCLLKAHGTIPDLAVAKAENAYGPDIAGKLVGVLNLLRDAKVLEAAARSLDMEPDVAASVVGLLRAEGRRLWPDAGIEPVAWASSRTSEDAQSLAETLSTTNYAPEPALPELSLGGSILHYTGEPGDPDLLADAIAQANESYLYEEGRTLPIASLSNQSRFEIAADAPEWAIRAADAAAERLYATADNDSQRDIMFHNIAQTSGLLRDRSMQQDTARSDAPAASTSPKAKTPGPDFSP